MCGQIMASLLARTPCHLASPEWTTVPYELHPKSSLDSLFDVISVIPSLFHRTDRVLSLPSATIGRRLKVKDLLTNCLSIEMELARWYARIEAAAAGNRDMPLLYWIHGSLNLGGGGITGGTEGRGRVRGRRQPGRQRHAQIPFADTYDFASTVTGLGHVYYWTALMLLYECMAVLVETIFYDGGGTTAELFTDSVTGFSSASVLMRDNAAAPVRPVTSATSATSNSSCHGARGGMQSSPNPNHHMGMLPGRRLEDLLPPGCDPSRYQVRERRKLAANICRSLDWAIGPLAAPSVPRGRRGGNGQGEEDQRRQQQVPQFDNDNAAIAGHPNLTLAPLHVVERFYSVLWSPDGRDGELERAWCCDFRDRLEQRGREVEAWIGGRGGGGGRRGWIEVGRLG